MASNQLFGIPFNILDCDLNGLPTDKIRNHCAWCNKSKKHMMRCGRCHNIWYCSKECQRSDWRDRDDAQVGHYLSCALNCERERTVNTLIGFNYYGDLYYSLARCFPDHLLVCSLLAGRRLAITTVPNLQRATYPALVNDQILIAVFLSGRRHGLKAAAELKDNERFQYKQLAEGLLPDINVNRSDDTYHLPELVCSDEESSDSTSNSNRSSCSCSCSGSYVGSCSSTVASSSPSSGLSDDDDDDDGGEDGDDRVADAEPGVDSLASSISSSPPSYEKSMGDCYDATHTENGRIKTGNGRHELKVVYKCNRLMTQYLTLNETKKGPSFKERLIDLFSTTMDAEAFTKGYQALVIHGECARVEPGHIPDSVLAALDTCNRANIQAPPVTAWTCIPHAISHNEMVAHTKPIESITNNLAFALIVHTMGVALAHKREAAVQVARCTVSSKHIFALSVRHVPKLPPPSHNFMHIIVHDHYGADGNFALGAARASGYWECLYRVPINEKMKALVAGDLYLCYIHERAARFDADDEDYNNGRVTRLLTYSDEYRDFLFLSQERSPKVTSVHVTSGGEY